MKIKFRYLDKNINKVYDNLKSLYDDNDWLEDQTFQWFVYELFTTGFSNIDLLLSTGLKDKNGKEIFAGDIVKAEDGMWALEIRNLEDGLVLVNNYRGEMSISHSEGKYSLTESEIVGDIYNNPELLK